MKSKIDLGSMDGMSNLRREQLYVVKSQEFYTPADAERDYAAGNAQALLNGAYRISDGAAEQYAKLSGFKATSEWFAAARMHACEKTQGWRPSTKYKGLPITFPAFIMRTTKQWCDRERGKYNKEKGEKASLGETLVVLDMSGTAEGEMEYVEERQAKFEASDTARNNPGLSDTHPGAERLNPKDDGERGGRVERITQPITSRYFPSQKYDATDEPGMLEDYLATIPAPVDRQVFGGWLRNSRPGTRQAVRRYARGARRKVDGHTEAQVLDFARQVWALWEEFREFAAGHKVAMPVWDIRLDVNGIKTVFLPPGLTAAQMLERPDLILSLAAALNLGDLTEKYWLEAHPGKLPKHFKNEWGEMLYTVKKLEPADRQGFEAWLRRAYPPTP